MSGFKKWAVFHKVPDKIGMFELDGPLQYKTMDGEYFIVPEGFQSDLGSIPRLFWNIVQPSLAPSSFFLHDWLCENSSVSRWRGDQILFEALILTGISRWKATVIYWGVRLYAVIRGLK